MMWGLARIALASFHGRRANKKALALPIVSSYTSMYWHILLADRIRGS